MDSLFADWLTQNHIKRIVIGLGVLGVLCSRLYLFVIRPLQFFDESLYLAYVRGVVKHGAIPPWSANPGVALLNSIWFAPLYDLPFGLDYASRMGMFVAECATFLALVWIARQLFQGWIWSVGITVFALVAAPFWSLTPNSSDVYYTLFVALALAALLIALRHPPSHISWFGAALIIAVSATIRNDGILVYVGATLLYGVHLIRMAVPGIQRLLIGLRVWFLPLGCVGLVYWLLIFRAGGIYFPYNDTVGMNLDESSVSGRTYLAFEQGEGYAQRFELAKSGKTWWVEGPVIARDLYGTKEQNQENVLLALSRNPGAWLNRIKWNFRDFFLGWHEAFTLHALPIFMAALWGWGLAWRRHWRLAVSTLVLLAPTVIYFLFTFWNYRYIIFLTPLWIVLAMYAVYIFGTVPQRSDQKWNLMIALSSGGAAMLFIAAVEGRSVAISLPSLVIAGLIYGLFVWRFVAVKSFPARGLSVSTVVMAVALIVGTIGHFPSVDSAANRFQVENRSYLLYAYEHYRDMPVCVNYGDISAVSLAWHARQIPIQIVETTMADAAEAGTLTETFRRYGCRFGLQTEHPEEHLRIIGSTPNRVNLFLQGWNNVFFFEITNEPPDLPAPQG